MFKAWGIKTVQFLECLHTASGCGARATIPGRLWELEASAALTRQQGKGLTLPKHQPELQEVSLWF